MDSNSGSERGDLFWTPPPLDGPEMKEMPYCRGRWDYRSGVLWQTLARLLESLPETALFWWVLIGGIITGGYPDILPYY